MKDGGELVKYLSLAISVLVGLTPIVVAFHQHSWNLQSLITPIYSPPRVDYSIEIKEAVISERERVVQLTFELSNLGDVGFSVRELRGKAVLAGEITTPIELTQAIDLPPATRGTMTIKLPLDESAVLKLVPFIMTKERITVEITSSLNVHVLSSMVTVPFRTSLTIESSKLHTTDRP
ncbi:MAG: hypothetical protein NZ920_05950 [Aigarchaeota archaeon]|nr:hypothetical protein [Aigarchaeota archaeon]MDW8092649.1 hypothetical protein [Nitrososphaerota archaeon]